MKLETSQDLSELCKKINKQHRAFGGNCGNFALALARELTKQDIKCSLVVCSSIYDEDLEEMNYSPRAYEDFETDIYHVALGIGDMLFDGSGEINLKTLKKIAKDEYDDSNPMIYSHRYTKENDNDFRYAFEWGTNHDVYPEYYQKLIQKELGIVESLSKQEKDFESKYKGLRCSYRKVEDNYKGLEDKYAQYKDKECTIMSLNVSSPLCNEDNFDRSYWNIKFDDNVILESVEGSALSPIGEFEEDDCLELLNLLNK